MECNNTHCLWNMFDQCCHESEEGFDMATPNALDCPSSLRTDFQYGVSYTFHYVCDKFEELNTIEQRKVLNFVLDQRQEIDNYTWYRYIGMTAAMIDACSRRKLLELLEIRKFIDEGGYKNPWSTELADHPIQVPALVLNVLKERENGEAKV
ncbi:hypothetical protein Goe5_c01400 [Bacillus phage vB_BthM-Goe5]|nr:hypothetical protein Goe5_c01400 [Bacillus phage vB_BthM-Goe5]